MFTGRNSIAVDSIDVYSPVSYISVDGVKTEISLFRLAQKENIPTHVEVSTEHGLFIGKPQTIGILRECNRTKQGCYLNLEIPSDIKLNAITLIKPAAPILVNGQLSRIVDVFNDNFITVFMESEVFKKGSCLYYTNQFFNDRPVKLNLEFLPISVVREQQKAEDCHFMKEAIRLLSLSPTPTMGCIFTSAEGDIIADGHHCKGDVDTLHCVYQAYHMSAENDGLTVYCTSVPCNRCRSLFLDGRIRRVVIGLKDDDIDDDQLTFLEDNLLEETIRKHLNIQHGRSYCVVKTTMTLDGVVVNVFGNEAWINNADFSNFLRSSADAIIFGANTVSSHQVKQSNDSILNVVVDSSGRIPFSNSVFVGGSAVVFTTQKNKLEHCKNALEVIGDEEIDVEVVVVPSTEDGKVSLPDVLSYLAKNKGVAKCVVLSGPTLQSSFIESGLVDEIDVWRTHESFQNDGETEPLFFKFDLNDESMFKLNSVTKSKSGTLIEKYTLRSPFQKKTESVLPEQDRRSVPKSPLSKSLTTEEDSLTSSEEFTPAQTGPVAISVKMAFEKPMTANEWVMQVFDVLVGERKLQQKCKVAIKRGNFIGSVDPVPVRVQYETEDDQDTLLKSLKILQKYGKGIIITIPNTFKELQLPAKIMRALNINDICLLGASEDLKESLLLHGLSVIHNIVLKD